MGFNTINLNNIKLDDDNFDVENPKLLLKLDLQLGVTDLNNAEHVKKYISKELMPVA